MFKELVSSSVLRTALALLAVFAIAAWLVPTPALIFILNYAAIVVAVAVVVTFLPGIWEAIRMKRLDYVSQLTLGIGMSWASIVVMRGWIGTSKMLEQNWSEHLVVAFYIYMTILGGVLHITAPAAISPASSKRVRATLAMAMGVGGLIAGLLIGIQWGSGKWG